MCTYVNAYTHFLGIWAAVNVQATDILTEQSNTPALTEPPIGVHIKKDMCSALFLCIKFYQPMVASKEHFVIGFARGLGIVKAMSISERRVSHLFFFNIDFVQKWFNLETEY